MAVMIYTKLIRDLQDRKAFFLLIDPDQQDPERLPSLLRIAEECSVDLILVGGSLIRYPLDNTLRIIKSHSNLPVLLFPGSLLQISGQADGLLLLSLISGRNPEYLIGNHVVAAPLLRESGLEIIPTGYILIENGHSTSVEYMSNTQPIPASKPEIAVATAMAGEMLGLKLIYLEAGSGAARCVPLEIVKRVKDKISVPLVVGGGIRTPEDISSLYDAGADAVVVGTAVEQDSQKLCSLAAVARK